ncbi:MAG TPA: hypothetical protein VNY30_24740, partial [Bryobacteraceae bacterium]|nr:hypothetical protein [Bryobacteraceae bacterium]
HPYGQRNELDPENHIDSVALLDASWKLVYRENGKLVGLNNVELYDRRSDRGETKNVSAQYPQQVGRMMTGITTWTAAQKKTRSALGHGAKAAVDQQTLDRLRSLGYLGGKP